MRHFTFLGALVCGATLFSSAAGAQTDPKSVLAMVEHRASFDGASMDGQMVISRPKGKLVYGMRALTKQAPRKDPAKRSAEKLMLFFISPADKKGTGLLMYDYAEPAKSDDQWLFLPSLRKSTRIAGSDKTSAFMGSDFSYSDMGRHHVAKYNVKMLKEKAVVDGDECWLIEVTPKSPKTVEETGYVKTQIWASKQKKTLVQARGWLKAGKKIKLFRFAAFKKHGNVWWSYKWVAQTRSSDDRVESTTVLDWRNLDPSASLTDSDFSVSRLEQGAPP